MNKVNVFKICLIFFVQIYAQCHAQKVVNVRASIENRMVIIDYDLISPDPFQQFDIDVYCSYEPEKELIGLRGDIGLKVTAGLNRQVTWDVKQDYEDIGGEVFFEVVAKFEPLKNAPSNSGEFELYAEYPAEPEGGYELFYANIGKRIRYPSEAVNTGVDGMVLLQFIVELDGSLSNFNVTREICNGCGVAAINALKNTKWKPAENKGKRVRQQITVPVKFKILGNDPVNAAFDTPKKVKVKEKKPELEISKSDEIIMNPDQAAKPRGGYEALYPSIGKNFIRPNSYRESEINTVIQAVIENNGKVSGVTFLKEIDEKVMDRLLKQIQAYRWEPAIHQGAKVRTIVTFPLRLRFE